MRYEGGNFSSPGYDGVKNYTSNLNCEWTIENPSRYNSSIYISFEDFHLEHHQDCQYDYLELRIGLYVQQENGLNLSRFQLCNCVCAKSSLYIFAESDGCRICTFERVFTCMPSMLPPRPGVEFHCQSNGCMDLVTLSFRGENGKLDRCLEEINWFGGCNTHLTLSLQGTIQIALHLP